MKNRFISVLLVLCMVLTMVPMQDFATNTATYLKLMKQVQA